MYIFGGGAEVIQLLTSTMQIGNNIDEEMLQITIFTAVILILVIISLFMTLLLKIIYIFINISINNKYLRINRYATFFYYVLLL